MTHSPTEGLKPEHQAPDQVDEAVDLLGREFTGWRFWRTRERRMIAATRLDESAGVSPTLVEDTVEQMREALERERAAVRRPQPGMYGL